MKLAPKAFNYASKAHEGQTRKYTGEPYIFHPIAVASIVTTNADEVTDDMICAALLHDVVEDTEVTIEQVEYHFNPQIAGLVAELTDQYTKEAYPELNRAARKKLETERLAEISPEAQTIKYADLIHNTSSIVEHDPGFAKKYLAEKRDILEVMDKGDATLYAFAKAMAKSSDA